MADLSLLQTQTQTRFKRILHAKLQNFRWLFEMQSEQNKI